MSVEARNRDEAKRLAAEKIQCRASSCLFVRPDGMVTVYLLKNLSTRQKHKIKADDFESARHEMASASDSAPSEWIYRDEELVADSAVADIQYLTFDTSF